MKYRQPDFVRPFYCKGKGYWYYDIYISVGYLNRPCSCRHHLGKGFKAAITKLTSVWNPFLRIFFSNFLPKRGRYLYYRINVNVVRIGKSFEEAVTRLTKIVCFKHSYGILMSL